MQLKRLGSFVIDRYFLEDNYDDVVSLFSTLEIIPVRTELDYASNNFKYMALSKYFPELGQGRIPPSYAFVISEKRVGRTKKFIRSIGLADVSTDPRGIPVGEYVKCKRQDKESSN